MEVASSRLVSALIEVISGLEAEMVSVCYGVDCNSRTKTCLHHLELLTSMHYLTSLVPILR